jgi:hypothetical protein
MRCEEVELVLEREGLEPLPEAARAHLAECRECRNYIADLASIVDTARKLPNEIAPPERIWVSLRAQLEAEGIIKPATVPVVLGRTLWWQSLSNLLRGRALATAAVGLLIAAAAVYQVRRNDVPPSQGPGVDTVHEPASPLPDLTKSFASTASTLNEQEPLAKGMIVTSTSPVDDSLRENLQKIDEFIAECELRLKQHPEDELAREYLSLAYQQKAELLSAMIERGRSIN